MAIKEGQEGIDFQGRRGVNAGDALHDRDLVTLRQLKKNLASFSGSSSSLSGVSIISIGQGYPVYAGLNSGNYEFRSLSSLTPNLLMYCGDTITFALNDNLLISGLTATTISAGTINAGLYLSAGTPIEQYFDRYWTASTGNQSVVRKFGNHSSPGSYSIVSGGKNHINNGNYSGIFAGSANTIGGNFSVALNGRLNTTLLSGSHSIISGEKNIINSPYSYNTILNSKQSTLSYSRNSIIINGSGNTIGAQYNSIINGINNYISFSDHSAIIGGTNHGIQGSDYSVIIGGKNSFVGNGYSSIVGGINHLVNNLFSSVLGGSGNTVNGTYSAVIGGRNIIINNNNTVAVPYLRIVNTSIGGTYMLTTDNNGYVFRQGIPLGGSGTFSGVTNLGGTHGIYAGSTLGRIQLKSLSGGSNIIITSSSTENAISLSPNVSINSLFVSGNTVLSSTTAMTMTVLNLSGSGTQMVVVNNFGALSGQSVPTPGLGGFGTITNATNTGSTHGIYAGLSGSSVLVFKSLSGGSNIIITSSSTENAIALSNNIAINSLTASGNSVFTGTLSGGSSFSANTIISGSTNLYSIFSLLGHTHPLTDITGGNLGDTIRHNGTNWVANNFLYNPGHKIGINNTNLNSTLSVYSTGSTTATTSLLIYNNNNERLLSFWANGQMEINPVSTLNTNPGTPFSSPWILQPIYPSRLFVQDWTDAGSVTTGKTAVLIQGQSGNNGSGNTALWVRSNLDGSTSDAVAVFEHSNPLAASPRNTNSIIRVIGGFAGILRTGLTINSDCITAFGTGVVDSNTQVLISLEGRTSMGSFNGFKLIDNNNSQLFNIRGDGQVTVRSLTGATTQMVVANSSGVLSVQTIPSGGGSGGATVNNGINTFTAGTSTFQSVNVTALTISTLIASGNSVFSGTLSGGSSFSANTLFSGTSNLSSLFVTQGELSASQTFIQNGTNTYTGGTDLNPTVNVSALTINTLIASGNSVFNGTLSASTLTANTITATTISASTLAVNGVLNQNQFAYLSSPFSTTSASLTDVTGMSFTIQPFEVWQFEISGQMSGSTINGQNHAISVPTGAILRAKDFSNTNAVTSHRATALNASNTQSSTVGTNSNVLLMFELKGLVSGSSTSGTVQFRLKANTAGDTETIQDGTYLIANRIK